MKADAEKGSLPKQTIPSIAAAVLTSAVAIDNGSSFQCDELQTGARRPFQELGQGRYAFLKRVYRQVRQRLQLAKRIPQLKRRHHVAVKRDEQSIQIRYSLQRLDHYNTSGKLLYG